jgi:hypothetical protein
MSLAFVLQNHRIKKLYQLLEFSFILFVSFYLYPGGSALPKGFLPYQRGSGLCRAPFKDFKERRLNLWTLFLQTIAFVDCYAWKTYFIFINRTFNYYICIQSIVGKPLDMHSIDLLSINTMYINKCALSHYFLLFMDTHIILTIQLNLPAWRFVPQSPYL